MTKPIENNGFQADNDVLDAWDNRNDFLKKYEMLRTTTYPLKSREEVEESIATLNRLVNECGLSDEDKHTLIDSIKVVSQLFDNYGLSFALDFVHRNMEYALDEELERVKAGKLVSPSEN